VCHEAALRAAVLARDLSMECCATGNLATLAVQTADMAENGAATAQALLERYRRLCEHQSDDAGVASALMQLGELASLTGEADRASEFYSTAMQESSQLGEEPAVNSAKCSVAIVSGGQGLGDALRALQQETQ